MREFLRQRDPEIVPRVKSNINKMIHALNDLAEYTDSEERQKLLEQAIQQANHFQKSFEQVITAQINRGLTEKLGQEGALRSAVHQVEEAVNKLEAQDLKVLMLLVRRHEKDFIMRKTTKYVDRIEKRLEEFDLAMKASEIPKEIQINQLWQDYFAAFMGLVESEQNLAQNLEDLIKSGHKNAKLLKGVIQLVDAEVNQNSTALKAQITNHGENSIKILLICSTIGVLMAIFSWYQIKNFQNVLKRSIDKLSLTFTSLQSSSNEIASSSNSLAERSSEQAASIEETSSSMAEMTSMVSRGTELAASTAEQAMSADKAVKAGAESISRLRNGVDAASDSAKELSQAMGAIKASSDSISKIIKTIDEIAFQTNILALNAAVEAARAGEAGAGFAVVADEVRSLARRAAEAAQETQSLIEDSIQRSDEGVRVNSDVNERLNEALTFAGTVDNELNTIVTNVRKVDQSMGELRALLEEQQSGIEQVNIGVMHFNDQTQSSAASAEETASASQGLTNQAFLLAEVVDSLSSLVNRSKKVKKDDSSRNGHQSVEPVQFRIEG